MLKGRECEGCTCSTECTVERKRKKLFMIKSEGLHDRHNKTSSSSFGFSCFDRKSERKEPTGKKRNQLVFDVSRNVSHFLSGDRCEQIYLSLICQALQ